jgi:hypothetical protein
MGRRARVLQIGECAGPGELQGGAFGTPRGLGGIDGALRRRARRLRVLLLILDGLAFPAACHSGRPA